MGSHTLTALEEHTRQVAAALDAAALSPAEAANAVAVLGRIARVVGGMQTFVASRAADTAAWKSTGEASSAHWLARQSGTSVAEAVKILQTGERLHQLPATRDALRNGELSPQQAHLVADAAAADPAAEGPLLHLAGKASLKELQEESLRTRAAAEPDEMARYRAVHRSRFFRHRIGPDGAFLGTIRTTTDAGALLLNAIASARPAVFEAARRSGERSPAEAYDADALIELARRRVAPTAADGGADSEPGGQGGQGEQASPAADAGHATGAESDGHLPSPNAPTSRSLFSTQACDAGDATHSPDACGAGDQTHPTRATSPASTRAPSTQRNRGSQCGTVMRVDHGALLRGHTKPGELCEITGVGPVPVAVVTALIGRAFLAAASVDAEGEVVRVAHLGRSPTIAKALQRHLPWLCHGEEAHGSRGHRGAAGSPHGPPEPVAGIGRIAKIIVRVAHGSIEAAVAPTPQAEVAAHQHPSTCGVEPPVDGSADAALDRGADPPPDGLSDPLLEALRRDGVDVARLAHTGRTFRAHQRTALELRDHTCTVLGCSTSARLEIDHRTDWAHTHRTATADADRLCHFHHGLKTRHGWRLEPGTGKRALLPPRC